MSQASGWQEIHLSATNGRRGLVEQSRLHNEQRGARASLVCSLSALARVSGSGELVRLQEYGRWRRQLQNAGLDEPAVAEPPGLRSRPRWASGASNEPQNPCPESTRVATCLQTVLALLHGYTRVAADGPRCPLKVEDDSIPPP